MKKVKVVLSLLLIVLLSANMHVYSVGTDLYDLYVNESDEVIREEYFKSIESNDTEKQEVLLKIADERLEAEYQEYKLESINRDNMITPYVITGNESFYTIFDKGEFIYRYIDRLGKYGYSLSLHPKPDGPIFAYDWDYSDNANSWDIVVRRFADDYRWNYKNMDTMWKQYKCHYKYGLLKTPWNLEVDATTMNPITCN